MQQWRWIDKRLLVMLHYESLALHGGVSGIRDEGLLDSALSRAVNLAHYKEPDFADLAAAYPVGLVKNHAFVDGNKRVAFLAVGLFLGLNGYKPIASQVDATLTIQAICWQSTIRSRLCKMGTFKFIQKRSHFIFIRGEVNHR